MLTQDESAAAAERGITPAVLQTIDFDAKHDGLYRK